SFFEEFALERKGLNAVVRAIRHVHDAIVGNFNSVRRIELLRSRTSSLTSLGSLVVRLIPVRAPMTLVGAGVGVEHNDAAIPVTVGNKNLVGFVIHGDAGRSAQMRCVVAVDGHAAAADLQQKLSVLGELENLAVTVAVASEPDVVPGVNSDAVLSTAGTAIPIQAPFGCAGLAFRERRLQSSTIEPFVRASFDGPTPSLDVLAARAEFDN